MQSLSFMRVAEELNRRTCRYLRDLAKRRLGHSHVLNNPAISDGYLQAFLSLRPDLPIHSPYEA